MWCSYETVGGTSSCGAGNGHLQSCRVKDEISYSFDLTIVLARHRPQKMDML